MATLYVTEYSRMAIEAAGAPVLVGQEPSVTQTIAIAGVSASATLRTDTKFVRLHTDIICNVVFGPSPQVATTSNMRLAANQTEFFGVVGGHVLAVIQGT